MDQALSDLRNGDTLWFTTYINYGEGWRSAKQMHEIFVAALAEGLDVMLEDLDGMIFALHPCSPDERGSVCLLPEGQVLRPHVHSAVSGSI